MTPPAPVEPPPLPPAGVAPGRYPAELEETRTLADGTRVLLRAIRPADWRLLQAGFRRLSARDRHYRFLGGLNDMDEALARRLATVDYDRQIAFLALNADASEGDTSGWAGLGIVRLIRLNDTSAEIAPVIVERWKRRGLGQILMEKTIAWARDNGIECLFAIMLQENSGMRHLAQSVGFRLMAMAEDASLLQGELLL